MRLEDQVCSLELAKRLKELGVKQESLFYWAMPSPDDNEWIGGGKEHKLFYCEGNPINKKAVSAFTVAELGEMLPNNLQQNEKKCWLTASNGGIYWACFYKDAAGNRIGDTIREDTEANARAEMLIYLLENNMLIFNKSNDPVEAH